VQEVRGATRGQHPRRSAIVTGESRRCVSHCSALGVHSSCISSLPSSDLIPPQRCGRWRLLIMPPSWGLPRRCGKNAQTWRAYHGALTKTRASTEDPGPKQCSRPCGAAACNPNPAGTLKISPVLIENNVKGYNTNVPVHHATKSNQIILLNLLHAM
jgi:hypothetical protein